MVQHLDLYLTIRPPSDTDHLFVTAQGQPLTSAPIYYRCRQWKDICHVHVTPHRLRHTFATRLINQGVPLESIRRLLGHKTLYMTQRYARLHDSTLRLHFEQATAHIEGVLISDWPTQNDSYVIKTAEHMVNSM